MKKRPLAMSLEPDDRKQLVMLLIIRSNEANLYLNADFADQEEELYAERQAAASVRDFEWVEDADLPLTVAQVERWIREISHYPKIVFHGCERESLLAIDRLLHLCRVARAKAA